MKFFDTTFGRTRGAGLAMLVLLGSQLIGCGSNEPLVQYADVSGKVMYKGSALKMGTVSFQPTAGARAVGEIAADGTYKLKAVVGRNLVMIESHEPSASPGGPEAAKMMKADPVTYLPLKYASNASGLTFDVEAGKKNTADFDVK